MAESMCIMGRAWGVACGAVFLKASERREVSRMKTPAGLPVQV